MKVSFTMLIILMMIDCEVKRKEFPWEIKVGKGKKKKKKEGRNPAPFCTL